LKPFLDNSYDIHPLIDNIVRYIVAPVELGESDTINALFHIVVAEITPNDETYDKVYSHACNTYHRVFGYRPLKRYESYEELFGSGWKINRR
jgi:hypothetical protein